MKSIEWNGSEVIILDQTKLPTSVEYVRCTDWRQVAEAIKMLRVRGAPAIGVSAAYGLILAFRESYHRVVLVQRFYLNLEPLQKRYVKLDRQLLI